MNKLTPADSLEKIRFELGELDRYFIEIEGKRLKPSQCYRFGENPNHVLFNTNCPEGLREKIQAILTKYADDEDRS